MTGVTQDRDQDGAGLSAADEQLMRAEGNWPVPHDAAG